MDDKIVQITRSRNGYGFTLSGKWNEYWFLFSKVPFLVLKDIQLDRLIHFDWNFLFFLVRFLIWKFLLINQWHCVVAPVESVNMFRFSFPFWNNKIQRKNKFWEAKREKEREGEREKQNRLLELMLVTLKIAESRKNSFLFCYCCATWS